MRKISITVVVIAVATGLFLLDFHGAFLPAGVDVATHSLAPDFSLTDLTGQTLTLSTYRGKVVLLDFWATWCDPCREEIPHFVELQHRYQDQGFQVIGISMDDSDEPVREFYQTFQMNYPVAMGNANLGELYGGILGLPVAFVIDPKGQIAARYAGLTDAARIEEEIHALLKRPAR